MRVENNEDELLEKVISWGFAWDNYIENNNTPRQQADNKTEQKYAAFRRLEERAKTDKDLEDVSNTTMIYFNQYQGAGQDFLLPMLISFGAPSWIAGIHLLGRLKFNIKFLLRPT